MSLPPTLGRYEVLSQLATGGMAEILLGRVRGPGGFHRPVVLKRVLPHLAKDEAFRAMFLDEAAIVAGLRHANVVHVHELGEEDGELFLVLEYLAGESMSGLMRGLGRARQPLPLVLAAHLVGEACAGLHAAHELTDEEGRPRHVVHRDVSPQNLFVTYDGDVKVLDFGVAKARSRLTRTSTGHAKGKWGYMSPEQCRAEELDRRTDIFALGIVLHELLTGRRLFPEGNELAAVRAICDDPLPAPSIIRSDCPPALDAICMRALAKEPLDRYETADAMRLDLIRAAREIAPEVVPRDALAALMQQLFATRIADGEARLRAVRPDSAPPAATPPGSVVPEAPSTTSVSLPTDTRRYWIVGLAAALAVIGATVVLSVATWSLPSRERAEQNAAAQAPPERPPPSDVAVAVSSTPSGARVSVDGEAYGETPLRLRLPRGTAPVLVTLRKEGHVAEVRRVTPDVAEQRIDVDLAPVAEGAEDRAAAAPEPEPTPRARRRTRRAGGMDSPAPAEDPNRSFYLFD